MQGEPPNFANRHVDGVQPILTVTWQSVTMVAVIGKTFCKSR